MKCNFGVGLVLSLIMAAGCGSEKKPLSEADAAIQSRTEGLNEVGSLLTLYKGDHKKAPAKAQDLARYEPGLPIGYQRIKSGDVVVMWGAPVVEGGEQSVLAYEKSAPESGGYVLMQDGATVKEMTSEEFKAAPKAGKG
ncbi:hypothetical protein TA3x_003476 [Tundrisphaera sp. TA3]|uniref:hypothetical protein n=1 Tax=Tundrisphaera sp. TA3 TaxID=3435775 RepID=UPI003EBACA5E